MKKIILNILLLLFSINTYSQLITKQTFTQFNPIYEVPVDAGTTLIGGSLLGKEIVVNDASDGSPHTLIIYTPSADSSAFPSITNNLSIGSILTFNLKSIGDTIYIRSDDGVNGITGAPGFPFVTEQKITLRLTSTGWVNDDRIFYANSLADIENINARPGDVITVRNLEPIANFVVRSTTINSRYTGTAERKLKNGNFALVQPIDNKLYVNHFGAIPSDDVADDFYIQEAINYVIERDYGVLAFGKGTYTIDTGVVMARTVSPTNRQLIVSFETVHLEGQGPSYGTFNATTLEGRNPNGFIIAAQALRNSSIKNMTILMEPGVGVDGLFNRDSLMSYNTTYLRDNYYAQRVRTLTTSPNAAISIDPFGVTSPSSKYPLWTSSYNSGLAETSMFHIDGVSIAYTYIGIDINPVGQQSNGDNIRWTNSHCTSVAKVWRTKTSQSRQNSIDNIYLLSCETFIDNQGSGTPPSIRNVNGAGTIKELYNISTGFGPIRMDNCYFEGIQSIGNVDATLVSFNQCQFKFQQYLESGALALTAYGGSPIYFNDCSIQFFSNATNPVPLMFNNDYVEARSCHIETGVWLNQSISDGDFDKIRFYDCQFYAPFNSGGRDFSLRQNDNRDQLAQVQNQFLGSGTGSFSRNGHSYSKTNSFPFRQIFLESGRTITKEILNTSGGDTLSFRFTTSNPGMYQINDNIISDANLTTTQEQSLNEFFLGRVVKIKADTIWCAFGPYYEAANNFSSSINVFVPYYFTFPFWGDVTIGNDTIKNVYGYLPSVGLKYIDQDYDDYFDVGAYVVAKGADWVKMSHNAKKSGVDIEFCNECGSVSVNGSNPGEGYVQTGARWSNTGISGVDYLVCSKGGVFDDITNPPLWDTVWIQNTGGADIVTTLSVTADPTDYNVGTQFLANSYLQEINIFAICPSGAASNTQILLPATSSFYKGKRVRIAAVDNDGTFDVQISGSTNELWQGGSLGTSLTLTDGDSYTIICMEDAENPGNYLWIFQN